MTYEELQNEISVLVDSGTPELEDSIPSKINEAIQIIANEPGVILPSLKSIVSVSTVVGQNYTTLEAGYSGKLIYAIAGGDPIDFSLTLEDILVRYPDVTEEGDVEVIALEDQVLWYAKVPEAETAITLLLYALPAELLLPGDVPTCIPPHLHRSLIVSKVAQMLFDTLEQGEDDVNTNTQVYELQYEKALIKLRETLASRRRGMSRSMWNV